MASICDRSTWLVLEQIVNDMLLDRHLQKLTKMEFYAPSNVDCLSSQRVVSVTTHTWKYFVHECL